MRVEAKSVKADDFIRTVPRGIRLAPKGERARRARCQRGHDGGYSMKQRQRGPAASGIDVEFIRIFFRASDEEDIAHRWAWRLGRLLGTRVSELRAETTLAEMLAWAAAGGEPSLDFVMIFEPELRSEFKRFLDDADHTTFREMVECYAGWFRRPS